MMYNIFKDYNEPFPGEQPFFTDTLANLQMEDRTVGLNGINWYGTLYPYLYHHKDRLVYRFNQHFAFREIGSETVSRWMFQLQDRFDEIADRFNHAYKVYYDDELNLDEIRLGYLRKIQYSNEGDATSQSSSEGEDDSKFKDTPTNSNSAINNPTTQNIDISKSKEESQRTNKGKGESIETYEYHDEHTMDEVNNLIQKYKQIDEDFIKEFNQMFMGILTM